MMTETWIAAALGLVAGAGGGWLFFHLLALNMRLYATGQAVAAAALHLGRLGVVAATLLAVVVMGGALPLLAVLAGFLLVRPLLMRRYGRA
ncbi:MAG: N-ATPase subunit AtpR [Niveispirillum sp.]|uniref:N-ATPase subunit AtpR n=1 Tax=Niveispirillum sp. TaxID=1917217 RepID=UPI0040367C00